MTENTDLLTAARAEALFTSWLSAEQRPEPVEVAAAIRQAMRTYGGSRGCAAEVAAAYGEHPETAVVRMRWALLVVKATYPPPTVRPPRRHVVPRPARSRPAARADAGPVLATAGPVLATAGR